MALTFLAFFFDPASQITKHDKNAKKSSDVVAFFISVNKKSSDVVALFHTKKAKLC